MKAIDKAIKCMDENEYMMRIYLHGNLLKEEKFGSIEEVKKNYIEYVKKYGKYSAPTVYKNKNGKWIRVSGF